MPTYRCPTCDRVLTVERREDAPYRPFCSRRCELIDLGKWFDEEYRISELLEAPPGLDNPSDLPSGPDSAGAEAVS